MTLATKKRADGLYTVTNGGQATRLVLAKGAPPKYRQPQEWRIGVEAGERIRWLVWDQKGKAVALAAVADIMAAVEPPGGQTCATR